jgi:putative hydrolase of the HAD superfamily
MPISEVRVLMVSCSRRGPRFGARTAGVHPGRGLSRGGVTIKATRADLRGEGGRAATHNHRVVLPPLLLCDLDNTLIDRAAGFRAWAEHFAGALGRGREDVEWLVAIDHDGMRAREPIFEEVRARWDIDAPVADLVRRYRQEYPRFVPAITPEVAERLAGLRRGGWRVAVVTNGPPSQRAKVEGCGLLPLIDAVVISDEIGVSKPDLHIFREAARVAGGDIGRAWLIGDNPEADIAAAVAMGIPGIWLRRGRTWTETGWRPFAVAESMAEALSLIPG